MERDNDLVSCCVNVVDTFRPQCRVEQLLRFHLTDPNSFHPPMYLHLNSPGLTLFHINESHSFAPLLNRSQRFTTFVHTQYTRFIRHRI